MLLRYQTRDPFSEFFQSPFFANRTEQRPLVVRPAVDARETDEAFVLEVEMPGFKVEDLEIEYEKGSLTLKGHREDKREQKDGNWEITERHFGTFARTFQLPDTIDSENIAADLEDGILTLTLPKRETEQPKKIAVQVRKTLDQ